MTSSSNHFSFYGGGNPWPEQKRLAELMALDISYFPQPWSEKSWEVSLKNKENYGLVVLEKESKPMGFALFHLVESDQLAHLLKMIILPDIRQKGLGQELLGQGLEYLKGRGFSRFFLEVECNNTGAIALYKRQGFKELQILKNFYGAGRNGQSMIYPAK